MKLIKRYANRRLYDSETSKTITLDDVADLIKAGNEVRVVDNISGEDITARVLGQTFLKISTDQQNLEFSTFLLTALIREVSSNVSRLFSQLVEGGIGIGQLTLDRLEKIVQGMVEQGEINLSEKNTYLDRVLTQIKNASERMLRSAAEGRDVLRSELLDVRNRRVEELSEKLDEMARIIKEIQRK
ncbi:MAG: polyhydroxyalkanoate biosynthesis repressor PhaR [Leptospirales bacterium]|nr:polyhydroxyalkanoate biosynthesis repressor PhaR [Leptospirales bacterium]